MVLRKGPREEEEFIGVFLASNIAAVLRSHAYDGYCMMYRIVPTITVAGVLSSRLFFLFFDTATRFVYNTYVGRLTVLYRGGGSLLRGHSPFVEKVCDYGLWILGGASTISYQDKQGSKTFQIVSFFAVSLYFEYFSD